MKKSLLLGIFFAFLCASSSYARPYVSGSIGLGLEGSEAQDAIDYRQNNSVVVNGAIGYNCKPARIELGIGYQKHAFSDHPDWAGQSFTTVMVNGYYDFDMESGFSPYLPAGAGIADVNTADYYVDKTVFAWKVGAGVGVKVASNITLDLGYQYLSPERLYSVNNEKVNWTGHNIMAGIRYNL